MTDVAGRFKRFDAADYLESEEDIAAYLEAAAEAAAEDGDPAPLVTALDTVARARARAHGRGT